jgi:hypothetical protein
MSEVVEVLQTMDRLHAALADLTVRGLRSAGQAQLGPLEALREELERIGAAHLAGRITALLDCVRGDSREAAPALLRAQTSLRLFERILTLEQAEELLLGLMPEEEDEAR